MKLSGFLFGVLIILSGCAEKPVDNTAEVKKSKEALYKRAMDLKDQRTAAVALNELILLDSSEFWYKDSLCRIYMKAANYEGGIILAEEVVAAGKADDRLRELLGVSYQQVQEFGKAKDIFSQMFEETNDYRYLYQVAAIAYESGNKSEFEPLTKRLLDDVKKDTGVANTKIEFAGPVTGVGQMVPLKAATYFLIGKFEQDHKQNYTAAVVKYEQAIGAYEKFEMPYYYLNEIEKARKQGLIR